MNEETIVDLNNATNNKTELLGFSASTRRLPVLFFWIFLGLSVIVTGTIAHSRSNWQAFWNQEAVLKRETTLRHIPLGILLDSLTTWINAIFIKGGWIVAAMVLIFVQILYVILIVSKRNRAPALRFIQHFPINQMISIELFVLFTGTLYFLFCTWTFNIISERIGSCAANDSFQFPAYRSTCLHPQVFRGFDISGHCFLIVHSCLLALEYLAKLLFVWKTKTQSSLNPTTLNTDKDSDVEYAINEDNSSNANQDHLPQLNNHLNRNRLTYKLIVFFAVFSVMLLCSFELLIFMQTILFYHTVLEKILGTLIGAGYWIGLFILSFKYPYLF